ncbi:MAG TPA: hypothetical protein VMJ10_35470 [Kofleriaceae bacterium]|nr:hypothetical protein [Kofleriaceae bacterium]
MVRVLAIAALVVSISATARAQAPGDSDGYYGAGPGAQPMAPATPPQFVACGAVVAPINVMANRWAVGFSVGSMTVQPKDSTSSADQTQFGVGELALRFRLTPHLEIEGAVGGGRQQMSDGSQGDLQTKTALLSLRYRFMPGHHWNWWLMGGIGDLQIAQHDASDQDFQNSQRPVGALGIGIERRFHNFALQAELRGMGIGQTKAQQAEPAAASMSTPVDPTTGMPVPPPPSPSSTAADQLSGGQLTIGASYYF